MIADAAGRLHDFNNALQGISASLSRLATRSARGEDDVSALIESMQQQVTEIASLGAQLGTVPAPAAGRTPDQRRLVAVGPFLSAMVPQVEALLPRNVRFELAAEGDAGMVACVPARLASVIRNLVLNARDAMEGGGSLFLGARRVRLGADGGSSFAEITVRDTGCGMTPDILEQCLEPFVTTKATTGGSGLGLHQVQVFADGLGGSVRVRSRHGEGTTVLLLLPDDGASS